MMAIDYSLTKKQKILEIISEKQLFLFLQKMRVLLLLHEASSSAQGQVCHIFTILLVQFWIQYQSTFETI